MKISHFIICILPIMFSCNKANDPSTEIISSYSFSFTNPQATKNSAGEYLADSIHYKVLKQSDPVKESDKVVFEIVRGGGSVSVQEGYTDNNGMVSAKWKLGTACLRQVLRASVYDPDGRYLSSSNLTAYGFRLNQWDTIPQSVFEGSFSTIVSDSLNAVTLMTTNNALYRQGANYYDWVKVTGLNIDNPRTIQADSNGIMYITNWKGELFKSTDHGNSWVACTKPIPSNSGYYLFRITSDNYLWADAYNKPFVYSKDGGLSWQAVEGGVPATFELGDIFRLTDGTLIMHSLGMHELYRSSDDGKNWTLIPSPKWSNKLFVDGGNKIFLTTQENGFSLYKSTDMGQTFVMIFSASVYFTMSPMDDIFCKAGNFYYIAVPGYGIVKMTDFTDFALYWYNNNLRNLFIDYNGVLFARDMQPSTMYYRKNS